VNGEEMKPKEDWKRSSTLAWFNWA